MFWMKPAVYHIRYGYIIIPQNNTLACSSETPDWRVLLTRRVFYHCFNTFSVCCNDFLTCCWVLVACCLNLVCCYNTLRRVLLEKQHTDVSWLQKVKFLEHVSVSYKHVCVLKQHANNTSRFLVYITHFLPCWSNKIATGCMMITVRANQSVYNCFMSGSLSRWLSDIFYLHASVSVFKVYMKWKLSLSYLKELLKW